MRTVLLIEDDHDTRVCLRICLEAAGIEVISAVDEMDGLETLKNGLRPAAVILDLYLPFISGMDFLAAKNQAPELASIPVIVLSTAQIDATDLGAHRFFRKPFDIHALCQTIESIKGGESSVTC